MASEVLGSPQKKETPNSMVRVFGDQGTHHMGNSFHGDRDVSRQGAWAKKSNNSGLKSHCFSSKQPLGPGVYSSGPSDMIQLNHEFLKGLAGSQTFLDSNLSRERKSWGGIGFIHVYMYVCVYACVYMCMYLCVCVHRCVHIPTQVPALKSSGKERERI